MKQCKFFSVVLCTLLLLSCLSVVYSKDTEGYSTKLENLKKRLTGRLESFKKRGAVYEVDITRDALSRIDAALAFANEKPGDKNVPKIFASCSLLVEAASVEISAKSNQAKVRSLQDKLANAMRDLNSVHESILEIERSQASKLKADLDEEQRKAQKLREEAERKFNELQSALIQVKKDARGTIISMSDILFDIGKATLKPDLKTSLAKIAGILTVFKDSRVFVEGHTDNQGSEEYNQTLSEKRAQNVMDFLIEQGIAIERLQAVGYGFSRPIADNSTKEGRQKNRRVDLVIQESNKQKSEESDW